MHFLLLPFLLSPASAGKLAEGFRGVPFGDATPLAAPPLPGCVKNPEAGVLWRCASQLGEFPVTVYYMVGLNTFMGISIHGSGYSVCEGIRDTLKAGWGVGAPADKYDTGPLPEWRWHDDFVLGSFDYNRFSSTCTAMTMHMGYYREMKEKKEKEAVKGTGDL